MARDFQTFHRGMSPSQIRASALQTHTDAAKRIDNIHAVPPLYVQRRASSITIGMHPQRRSRGGAAVGTALGYRFRSFGVDYINCDPIDGGEQVKIALPYKSRRTPFESIDGEADNIIEIDGMMLVYTYSDANKRRIERVDVTPHIFQDQIIVPRYNDGDLLFAIACAVTDVSAVDEQDVPLLDLNVDNRGFSRIGFNGS